MSSYSQIIDLLSIMDTPLSYRAAVQVTCSTERPWRPADEHMADFIKALTGDIAGAWAFWQGTCLRTRIRLESPGEGQIRHLWRCEVWAPSIHFTKLQPGGQFPKVDISHSHNAPTAILLACLRYLEWKEGFSK